MTMFDEIKKQITQDEENSNKELPWTFENINKEEQSKKKLSLKNNKLTKYGLIIMLVVISAIGVYNFINSKNSVNIEKVNNEENNDSQVTEIQVHVAGEVNKPGLYKLNTSSRIWDAIMAAEGLTANADQNAINLAKTVNDGEQIVIPAKQNISQQNSNGNQASNGKVNINTADLTTLQTLSGVGPSTAQKIIDYRNQNGKFNAIEDIKKISGIGDKTFEKFKDKICV